MTTDWSEWHRFYDSPESQFFKRRIVVHELLANALDHTPPGPVTVLDICAGEGRVSLPLILEHARGADLHMYLIELDASSCDAARAFAAEHALANVTVIHGDAGLSDSYAGLPRADLVILSGVIRYLTRRDLRRTAISLRQVCAPSATVVWTHGDTRHLSIETIRRAFDHAGFHEIALRDHGGLRRTHGLGFVGEVQMTSAPDEFVAGRRWFRFRTRARGVKARARHIRRAAKRRIFRLT